MRDLILLDTWRQDAAQALGDAVTLRMARDREELERALVVCEAACDFFRDPSHAGLLDLGNIVHRWEGRDAKPAMRLLPLEDA